MAVDRGAYNAQVVGEELKPTSLRNSYTPGNFVSMQEEVTVAINGTDVTYPAGTWYGKIMQDQLDADGIKITVWDPTAEAGAGSSDGYDGWYNATNAAAEMAIAVEELKALGLEITAENPIYLDLPTFTGSEAYKNRGQAYKKSIEEALGGLVIINNTECVDSKQWYYAGYYPSTGAEGNYDICDLSGWGPDYGDPQTYLDTMLPDYAGYMTKAIGLF
jgi:peptide/nickel transport system substrate-binding protein/oligopeptide transport system substrate-binding protein